MAEGLLPDVHSHPVGDVIVDGVHQPLGRRRNQNHRRHDSKDPEQAVKVYLPFPCNQIHRLPD